MVAPIQFMGSHAIQRILIGPQEALLAVRHALLLEGFLSLALGQMLEEASEYQHIFVE